MAKEEKEYLSPTDKNPLLKVVKDNGDVVYRDQSTGEEYSQEWVNENGQTREELFPEGDADSPKKAKRAAKAKPADKPADEGADSEEDEGEDDEEEDDEAGASGPDRPALT